MTRPALSVVIPALNEAAALPALLTALRQQRGVALQILVSDGGSADATATIARQHRATVIAAPRGRAAQMNTAAAAARADWLLFLHADSGLTTPDQLAAALAALQYRHPDTAGHWPLHFVRTRPGHDFLFAAMQAKSASNRPGTINGDQGLLIRRAFFERLGGFDAALPLFEDQRLAARIFAHGRWRLLPGCLETSARRFEVEGHRARYALMALIVGADAAGLHDFLAALPALYREHARAGPLAVRPVLRALDAHLRALPPPRRAEVWARVGALVRDNAWQIPLWLQLRSGRDALGFFERHLERHLSGPASAQGARWLAQGFFALAFTHARRAA